MTVTAIYRPRGAALEYAPLALNLYRGCQHACRYCYVPGCLRMNREEFHASAEPRAGIINQLGHDLTKRPPSERVLLCFTTDPFQAISPYKDITRTALRQLRDHHVPFATLTKAGLRAAIDLDMYEGHDAEAGVSLVWADDRKRAEWEPGASPVRERIEYLAIAKARGVKTWVSMEPVIEPAEALAALDLLLPVADAVKVGRWNHDKRANAVDWRSFAVEVDRRLRASGKVYMLKKGLAELVPAPGGGAA